MSKKQEPAGGWGAGVSWLDEQILTFLIGRGSLLHTLSAFKVQCGTQMQVHTCKDKAWQYDVLLYIIQCIILVVITYVHTPYSML